MAKKLKWNLILMSLLYLALGIFLLMVPGTALNVVCYALGGVVLACAAVQLVRYFVVERGVFQSQLTLISGLVCLALGAFLIIRSDVVVRVLPIVFGLFVIFDSLGRIQNALELRRCEYSSWKVFLLLAVLSVVLGIVMVVDPFGTMETLVMAIGLILILEGALNLLSALYTMLAVRRFIKLHPETQSMLEAITGQDLNGDGVISYVMFKGQEGNAEAEARTQFGVEDANAVLTAAGKPELAYYNASATDKYLVDQGGKWSAQAANDYMATILPEYSEANGNMVELIICNNDNMAEGCISALESAGYNNGTGKTIPVFGVDATDSAKELIANGKMTGTVKQDAEGMAVAIASVVKAAGEGTAMADAVAATAGTNSEMYSIADGIANKLFVAYAAYTK